METTMETKEEKNTNPEEKEEKGIDIVALLRSLWAGRRTVFICLGIFIVLGVVAALTMKRVYTVQTVIVPQSSSARTSSLGSLAALAGIDMGMQTTGTELSPLVYPEIVNSVPYRLELMHTPLHYSKCPYPISMFDYIYGGYEKPTVIDYIKHYTVGLPGLIMGAISEKPKDIVLPPMDSTQIDTTVRPVVVTVAEQKMLDGFGQVVSLDINKKEGFLTLTVRGMEPIQTADLALKAQSLLQQEVTRHRTEKSLSELEYIQARYEEIKKENEKNQQNLAYVTDRSQMLLNTRDQITRDRALAKYNVSNAIFNELAKQLEQAKIQVKRDTPSYAVIQPVTIPMKPSNSRAKTVIVWTFLGFILGCGIVLAKGYMPKLKAMFKKPEDKPEEEQKPEEVKKAE
jgi:LPS O-antigen subunit length determinant protein (WzzB/FepE family)